MLENSFPSLSQANSAREFTRTGSTSRALALRICAPLVVCALVMCAGCASRAERDRASFEADTSAHVEVRRIEATLARKLSLQQSDLELLKSLHAKYPAAAKVSSTLQSALQARQDWDALEKLLTEKPAAERTPAEQVNLAKVYIKLGRYRDASDILGAMAGAAPNDLELNSLAGYAWYYEGKYDDAARAFDRVWDALLAAKKIDEMMMRGMIYFYKGDQERAAAVLKKTVEINPDYIAGLNALSRVYAAKGDGAQADSYRAQAESAHARQTADEARRMRLTSRAHDLEVAFAAGRYAESIEIVREMLQTADDAQKPALYQYLGQAYQATGKQEEAQAAFQEAARLQQQSKS